MDDLNILCSSYRFVELDVEGAVIDKGNVISGGEFDLYYIPHADSLSHGFAVMLKAKVLDEFEYEVAKEEYELDSKELYVFKVVDESGFSKKIKKFHKMLSRFIDLDEILSIYLQDSITVKDYIFVLDSGLVFITEYQV